MQIIPLFNKGFRTELYRFFNILAGMLDVLRLQRICFQFVIVQKQFRQHGQIIIDKPPGLIIKSLLLFHFVYNLTADRINFMQILRHCRIVDLRGCLLQTG